MLLTMEHLPSAEATALLINGANHSIKHELSALLTVGLVRHVTCAPLLCPVVPKVFALCEALYEDTSVVAVDLSYNHLGDAAAQALARLITVSPACNCVAHTSVCIGCTDVQSCHVFCHSCISTCVC